MLSIKYHITQRSLGSLGEQCVPARTKLMKLSSQGRAVLMREPSVVHCSHFFFTKCAPEYCLTASPGCFDKCPFPTREQKDAVLQEVRKTDPEYSMTKLIRWFSNRRRFHHEARKEQEDGGENALSTLLDPTTSLARESRPYTYVDTHRGLLYLLVWPSLSVEILHRLHTLLLEQPHPTAQHKELLAKHFGVEREHVENFLSWRLACLNNEDNDVWRENFQRGRKQLPTTAFDDDNMEVDELLESQSYLPTPAGSTSPEPVYGMTPFIRAKMGRRESLDTSPFAAGGHEPNSPISPGPVIESKSLSRRPSLHISPNATPRQTNSPVTTYFPSPVSRILRSPTKPTLVSPLSPSQSTSPNARSAASSPRTSNTRQEGRSRTGTHTSGSVASIGKPYPRAPGPATRTPRTLREFEEAYAPTYARIERFLRSVESSKLTHVGLTPEMLKQINP
jgi:hypothetical protein